MSQNTFDKAQTQYERRMQRQRQLDLMEAAASGNSQPTFDLSDATTGTTPLAAPTRSSSGRPVLTNAPPEGAIESARRFLWDEDDEDDYNTTSTGRNSTGFAVSTGGGSSVPSNMDVNQNINLMSTADDETEHQGFSMQPGSSGIGSRIMSSLPRFSARTGTEPVVGSDAMNLAPRRHSMWHSDASPATEAEEYLEDVEFGRVQRGGAMSGIGGCCLAFFQILVGCLSLLCEYTLGACAGLGRFWQGSSRKQKMVIVGGLASVGLLIYAATAIAKRGGGDGGSSTNFVPPPTSPPNSGAQVNDLERFNAIRQVILESTFTSEDELNTPSTAQNLAARWLADDDPAKMKPDDDMLLQRYALATFFFSTYVRTEFNDQGLTPETGELSDEWNRMDWWMSGKGICEWYGVSCPSHLHNGQEESHYNENSAVIHFNLTANNIRGTIPSELAALEDLETLDLGKNDLDGSIPIALTNYRFLTALYLEENDMTGTLPTELGKMTMLQDLYVGTNQFTGTIPSELNLLTGLHGLGLDECYLTGTIPFLWDLKGLRIMYLDDNELTGTLSDDVRYLTELEDFRLRKNLLNGTMPIEFHWLSNLQILYLDDNEFSGTVPEVFDMTTRLEELHLYKNNFQGVIPDSIEKLSSLKVLYLDNNYFEGTLPMDLGNLVDVQSFYAFNNRLEGEIPTHFGSMVNVKDLQLQQNKIHGRIPTELANCIQLEKLELQDNELTGNIPTEFASLERLALLKVYRNNLAGSVPEQVCTLKQEARLAFLATDCNMDQGGTHQCDCCDVCYP